MGLGRVKVLWTPYLIFTKENIACLQITESSMLQHVPIYDIGLFLFFYTSLKTESFWFSERDQCREIG